MIINNIIISCLREKEGLFKGERLLCKCKRKLVVVVVVIIIIMMYIFATFIVFLFCIF